MKSDSFLIPGPKDHELRVATVQETVRIIQGVDVVSLTEEQARALRDTLTELLGDTNG